MTTPLGEQLGGKLDHLRPHLSIAAAGPRTCPPSSRLRSRAARSFSTRLDDRGAGEAAGIFEDAHAVALDPGQQGREARAARDRIGAAHRRLVEPVSVVDQPAANRALGQAAAAKCLRRRRPCQHGDYRSVCRPALPPARAVPHAKRLSRRLASGGCTAYDPSMMEPREAAARSAKGSDGGPTSACNRLKRARRRLLPPRDRTRHVAIMTGRKLQSRAHSLEPDQAIATGHCRATRGMP
jgi:hypothetical protein